MATKEFNPALLIIDLQEDFCPPNGSLAVPDGRAILPTVNTLLTYPFTLKIATRDWHPADHISFASNHPGTTPYTSTTTITNPLNPSESYSSLLWPDHCIQDTPGAQLVPELSHSQLDFVVDKGQRREIEMYSAFYDPLRSPRVADSGLSARLKEKGITDVFVVGLAADYCVKFSALDAVREGFRTFVVEEGTRAVDPGGWETLREELKKGGVEVVGMESGEVRRILGMRS
ncbi:isochorismatase family protein [Xylogone sp. PMI_703]|nr:isochorismatase family protein [Xylogone sp. PMI_703]